MEKQNLNGQFVEEKYLAAMDQSAAKYLKWLPEIPHFTQIGEFEGYTVEAGLIQRAKDGVNVEVYGVFIRGTSADVLNGISVQQGNFQINYPKHLGFDRVISVMEHFQNGVDDKVVTSPARSHPSECLNIPELVDGILTPMFTNLQNEKFFERDAVSPLEGNVVVHQGAYRAVIERLKPEVEIYKNNTVPPLLLASVAPSCAWIWCPQEITVKQLAMTCIELSLLDTGKLLAAALLVERFIQEASPETLRLLEGSETPQAETQRAPKGVDWFNTQSVSLSDHPYGQELTERAFSILSTNMVHHYNKGVIRVAGLDVSVNAPRHEHNTIYMTDQDDPSTEVMGTVLTQPHLQGVKVNLFWPKRFTVAELIGALEAVRVYPFGAALNVGDASNALIKRMYVGNEPALMPTGPHAVKFNKHQYLFERKGNEVVMSRVNAPGQIEQELARMSRHNIGYYTQKVTFDLVYDVFDKFIWGLENGQESSEGAELAKQVDPVFVDLLEYITDPANIWNPEKFLKCGKTSGVLSLTSGRKVEVELNCQYLMGCSYITGTIDGHKLELFYNHLQGFQVKMTNGEVVFPFSTIAWGKQLVLDWVINVIQGWS